MAAAGRCCRLPSPLHVPEHPCPRSPHLCRRRNLSQRVAGFSKKLTSEGDALADEVRSRMCRAAGHGPTGRRRSGAKPARQPSTAAALAKQLTRTTCLHLMLEPPR